LMSQYVLSVSYKNNVYTYEWE